MPDKLTRRDAIRAGVGVALAAPALLSDAAHAAPAPRETLPTRVLGKTGQRVTVYGLGGASAKTPLSNGPRAAAAAVVNRALDLGVTYFDTAASYGPSEDYLGDVVKTRRAEMFLATKTDARTYDGAMRDLEQSLKRLQTDHLDLWQMHSVALHERDTVPFFGKDGATRAIEEARRQKLVRFAGVTGHHDPFILAEWLRRYPFDTLLTAVNAGDVHHPNSIIKNLLPVAREKGVGVIAMKIPAYGQLLDKDSGVGIHQALHYTLSQPGVACAIISCDSVAMLEENVAAARAFTPLSDAARAALEAKTAAYWPRAAFYREWT